jgi:hypothetical protein
VIGVATNIESLIETIKSLSAAEKFELARRLEETGVLDDNQSWYWTPRWQAAEKEADEDIAAGRVFHYNNVDDLMCSLRAKRERASK